MDGQAECGIVKHVPNALSGARIPLSLSLLLFRPFSFEFFVVYLICGLTDAFDGLIARTFHVESPFGAKLDSAADFTFFAVALYLFIRFLAIPVYLVAWALCVVCVRLVGLMVAHGRFGSWAALHTLAYKAVGFVFFCFPMLYNLFGVDFAGGLLCGIATLATVEEVYINTHARALDADIKGAFELIEGAQEGK